MSVRARQQNLSITGCSVPNNVQAGNNAEFTATVNNPTSSAQRVVVAWNIGGGVATNTVDVSPGEQDVTMSVGFGSIFVQIIGGSGTYDVTGQLLEPSGRDPITGSVQCGSITVSGSADEPAGGEAPEGEWNASIDVSSQTVAPGDSLTIEATVENVGNAQATDEFMLTWDGNNLCEQFPVSGQCFVAKSKDPGEGFTISVTMGPQATSDIFQGSHEIGVQQNPTSGGDTIATSSVNISAPQGFDPDAVNIECPGNYRVSAGERVEFSADVTNNNEQPAEVFVDFRVGNTGQSDTSVIPPGDSGTVSAGVTVDETWLEFAGIPGGGTADIRIRTEVNPA